MIDQSWPPEAAVPGRRKRPKTSGCRCGSLFRRDYLIGGAAGELRHVVELGGKSTYPGSRRADLDDQVADLGLRHHGLDGVPAGPTVACIEAENLPAPPRQDRVDLG